MKKNFLLCVIAVLGGLSILGAGCASTNPPQETPLPPQNEEKIKIAATIFPLYDIARTIAGNNVEVLLITPPGASPHYFEPTPSLLRELQGTDVIFNIGAELDDWVGGITDNVPGADVIDMSDHVTLQKAAAPHLHEDGEGIHGEEEGGAHDHAHNHAHGEFDPHYWLDPVIAKDVALHIAEELAKRDVANASSYVQRANTFAAELSKKDAEWKDALSGLSNKEIVTFHNAFGYFADHFGLAVVATFEPFAGQEPTAKYLAGLQEEIDVHNISTLFLEPQMPQNGISQFAKDNRLNIGVLDPLGGAEGRRSYIELIDYNVRTIAETNK